MKNKIRFFIKRAVDIIIIILFVFTIWFGYTTTTKTKAHIQSEISKEEMHFKDTIDSSIAIADITNNKDGFLWILAPNVPEDYIKGYRYLVKLDGIPVYSGFTYEAMVNFVPEYNGKITLMLTPVCIDKTIGVTSITSLTVDDVNLKNFSLEEDKHLAPLLEDTEFNNIFYSLLTTTGYTTIYDISILHNELKKIPIDILYSLQKDKYKINLTSYELNNIGDKHDNTITAGVFNPITKRIHINNTDTCIEQSTIHEIGHYIDLTLGVINYHSKFSSKFNDIFNSEKELVENPHHKSEPSEFFAYSYSQYISNPDSFRENYPKAFEYFENYLPNFKLANFLSRILAFGT